jgi:hypothetical protein
MAIFIDLLMVKTRYSVLGIVVAACAIPVYLWWKRRILESGEQVPSIDFRPSISNAAESTTV